MCDQDDGERGYLELVADDGWLICTSDWGEHFDDLDSRDWEVWLSGPDDVDIESWERQYMNENDW